MSTMGTRIVVCPTLIGRVKELTLLTDFIIQGSKGESPKSQKLQAAFIAGEAGIGKSRLVNEVIEIATQHDIFVLEGRCFEQDRAFPYAPLIDLLETYCAQYAHAELSKTIAPFASELIKIFPELSTYFPELSPSPMLDPEQEKRRLFQVFWQFLNRAGDLPLKDKESTSSSNEMPLLLVIEDLHWCDDTSLEFLLYLVRRSTSRPILLIGTYRNDEPHDALEHFLTELERLRAMVELRLPRLSLGETDNMLRAIFGAERLVHYDLLETLFELTEGNPFFIEEALKDMTEMGDWERIPADDLHIPRTVQVAVQERLAKLSPSTRHLISLAAVVGRRFDVSLLGELTNQPGIDLPGQLRELIRAQLVVEESADTYSFRHALTREAIYQNLLGRERQELHKTIARTLERIHANKLEPYLNDLAYHFYEAGEWAEAFEYARQAGERAQALDATRVALIHFSRALESAQELDIAPPLALWRARGQAHQTLGNLDAARSDYLQILQAARSGHDRQAEWQGLLDLGFLWTSQDYQRAGEYFQQALDLVRGLGEPTLLAQTLNRVGNWRFMAGQPLEGRNLHQEALDIIKSMDDPRLLAATLDLLGISSYGVGDLLMGGEYYAQAVSIYRSLGDRQGLIASLCAYIARGGCSITMTGICVPVDPAEIIREGEEAIRIANQMGWRPNEAYALSFCAFSLGVHGEFERTVQYGERSLSLATEVEHNFSIITAHVALGAVYLDLLDPEKARQHFETADQLAQDAGAVFVSTTISGYLAQTYLALGETERAERLLQARWSGELSLESEANRWLWAAKAEFLLAQGKADESLALIERVIAAAPHVADGKVSTRLELIRGQVLHALDRQSAAEDFLRKALVTAQECHLLPQVWRIQIALGKVLRAARRLSEAQEQFAAAQEMLKRLAGKSPEGNTREKFLEAGFALIPARPSSAKQSAKKEFGGMTARERDVAILIAQGCSNNEIADKLVLSRRTVEVHVANIMSKLGVRARAQIAVWVSEKRLTKS